MTMLNFTVVEKHVHGSNKKVIATLSVAILTFGPASIKGGRMLAILFKIAFNNHCFSKSQFHPLSSLVRSTTLVDWSYMGISRFKYTILISWSIHLAVEASTLVISLIDRKQSSSTLDVILTILFQKLESIDFMFILCLWLSLPYFPTATSHNFNFEVSSQVLINKLYSWHQASAILSHLLL